MLAADACADLPAGTTQYDGVISGAGSLRISASRGPGTLVLTADSTFALPAARQTETAFETKSPTDPNHVYIGARYDGEIFGTQDAGKTWQAMPLPGEVQHIYSVACG